jgi:MFS family permease
MLTPKFKFRFKVIVILNIFQQLSGINFLFFFSTPLFDELTGEGPLMTFMLSCGNFVASFLAMVVVKFGRKKGMSLATCFEILFIGSLIVGINYKITWLSAVSAFLFVVSFGIGLGSILFIYMTETVPAVGIGVAMAGQWLTSAIVAVIVPSCLKKFGVFWVFGFFMVCQAATVLFIQVYCIETVGKSKEEIVKEYALLEKRLKRKKKKKPKRSQSNSKSKGKNQVKEKVLNC